jgi:hypothetical protein
MRERVFEFLLKEDERAQVNLVTMLVGECVTEMDKVRTVVVHDSAEDVPIPEKRNQAVPGARSLGKSNGRPDAWLFPVCHGKNHAADAIDPQGDAPLGFLRSLDFIDLSEHKKKCPFDKLRACG